MSTVSTPSLSHDAPRGVASVAIDPRTYLWDETNNRPKSGYFTVSLTDISWESSGGGDDTVAVRAALADHHDDHATAAAWAAPVSDRAAGGPVSFHVAANYGVCGPGSRVNPDGSVSLVDVEFRLTDFAGPPAHDVVAAVTYSVSFTEVDPYGTSPMTANTLDLAAGPDRPTAGGLNGGMILAPGGGSAAAAVRLESLAASGVGAPGSFRAFAGGPLADHGVRGDAASAVTYRDAYTRVVAKNDGKYDRNALTVTSGSTTLVALAVAGLTARYGDLSATLTYRSAEF